MPRVAPSTGHAKPAQLERKTQVIAVANQKGGVGKTTTTQALGTALADLGDRVLLVDMDPQASLTTSFGLDPTTLTHTTYTVMCANEDTPDLSVEVRRAIVTIDDHLSLLPSNLSLSAAEIMLLNRIRREYVLADALDPILSEYDWVFLDCPPSLSILTINALASADACVVPVQPEPLVTAAVEMFFSTIANVRQRKLNPRLRIAGIILTRVDSRPLLNREVISQFVASLGGRIPILGEVRDSVRVREASALGVPLTRYKPAAEAASIYRQIAEVLRAQGRPSADS